MQLGAVSWARRRLCRPVAPGLPVRRGLWNQGPNLEVILAASTQPCWALYLDIFVELLPVNWSGRGEAGWAPAQGRLNLQLMLCRSFGSMVTTFPVPTLTRQDSVAPKCAFLMRGLGCNLTLRTCEAENPCTSGHLQGTRSASQKVNFTLILLHSIQSN